MKSFKQIREAKSSSGYDLYHKDFSGAMQHAYAFAKKKGYVVSNDDIDNKVAMGPKKPSSGKTNKYILSTQKKNRNVHIQVANLDNKRYELNMYIESAMMEGTDLSEALKTTHVVVDTADGNKVISTAAGDNAEKNMRMSIASAERPPLNIKNKKTLKVVKLKRPISQKKADDLMGQPLKEDFTPHKMYDPKTGKEYDAKTQADHEKYAMLGYTHDKPELKEDVSTAIFGSLLLGLAPFYVLVAKSMADDLKALKAKSAKKGFKPSKEDQSLLQKFIAMVKRKKPDAVSKAMKKANESVELKEAALKNVRGKDGKTYTLDFDMSGRKITVRTKNQFGDIKTISMKQAAKLFEDSILESAKRDAFRAMDKRGKDSADDDDVKATADDRKAADKNIIVQLRRVADLSKGGVIEFKNGKKVNLKQNLAKAVLMKYNTIKRNDQKLKFADMASQSPQDLQKALKLK